MPETTNAEMSLHFVADCLDSDRLRLQRFTSDCGLDESPFDENSNELQFELGVADAKQMSLVILAKSESIPHLSSAFCIFCIFCICLLDQTRDSVLNGHA